MSKVNTDKIISINDRWGFTVDTHGNHTPYQLKTVKTKGSDGSVSELAEAWKSEEKHFPNVGMVLQYITTYEVYEKGNNFDTLNDYLTRFKEVATIYREINNNSQNKAGV